VLRAADETETQKNIQDLFELDEGDPGFQFLVFLYFFLNKGSTVIFFIFIKQQTSGP
jgi:hypothetical protein